MLMPASSEFVALCRSQVNLLTQGLGASLSAVYLTEELAEDAQTQLIPIVVYPEEPQLWSSSGLSLPAPELPLTHLLAAPDNASSETETLVSSSALSLPKQQRLVLPLMHKDLVVGLLVVGREDRLWTEREREQLEQIAQTLAIACVLDQRYQWLERFDYQQRSLQSQQANVLANLLHQIRNPLTTIRTLGKLLLKRLVPEDANRKLATSMVQESDRLEELLRQFDQAIDLGEAALDPRDPDQDSPQRPPLLPLLPAAGLTTGSPLQLQPCWVAEILEPLLLSAQAIAQERQLQLRSYIPADLPPVQADPQALREVLSNLIDNALKYTPAKGEVQIWLQQKHETRTEQLVGVSNTGSEIPEADLPHLFERHYRGVQTEGKIPGTGLGLAIAKDLVQQMHGEIHAFNTLQPSAVTQEFSPVGSGTTFIVSLPEMDSNE